MSSTPPTGPATLLRSVPQAAARQVDEYIHERRRKYFETLQFVVFGFELLHKRDNRPWRQRGVQHVGAVKFTPVGNALQVCQRTVCERASEANLDSRSSCGAMF